MSRDEIAPEVVAEARRRLEVKIQAERHPVDNALHAAARGTAAAVDLLFGAAPEPTGRAGPQATPDLGAGARGAGGTARADLGAAVDAFIRRRARGTADQDRELRIVDDRREPRLGGLI